MLYRYVSGCQPVTKEKHYLKWRCTGRLYPTAIANEWEWLSVAAMFDLFNVPSKHVLMRTILKRQRNFQRQMVARICPTWFQTLETWRGKKWKVQEFACRNRNVVAIFGFTWCKPIQNSRCSNRWIDFAEASLGCFPWSGLEAFVLHPRLWRMAYGGRHAAHTPRTIAWMKKSEQNWVERLFRLRTNYGLGVRYSNTLTLAAGHSNVCFSLGSRALGSSWVADGFIQSSSLMIFISSSDTLKSCTIG